MAHPQVDLRKPTTQRGSIPDLAVEPYGALDQHPFRSCSSDRVSLIRHVPEAPSVNVAEEYFSGYEAEIASLGELEERSQQIEALATSSELTFYWRGQGSAERGVHSALHRRLAAREGMSLEDVTEPNVVAAEQALVEEAREWIRPSVGARLTSVDLLARLQHHGVPTRLLDFSRDPLVALFFACTDEPARDGRLIIGAARRTQSDELRNSFEVPWAARHPARPVDWSTTLHGLADQEDFLRISRQKGVFIVGGTPSTTPQRRFRQSLANLNARDVRSCMSLPLALHSWSQAEGALTGKRTRGRRPTVASALTLRVPAAAKPNLVCELEDRNYTHRRLFPDVQGLVDYGPVTRTLGG